MMKACVCVCVDKGGGDAVLIVLYLSAVDQP